jgi:NAD(P)-dependent dehydrogenase (short-subunit alcohol dehydrogenase family)
VRKKEQTESTNPQIWDNIKESNPLKRLCTPNDIGSLIEYIALEGLYINGNIIYVNGGSHLR